MKIITYSSVCVYPECKNTPVVLVYDRKKGEVVRACRTHATEIVQAPNPEYVVICSNCGCEQPIN